MKCFEDVQLIFLFLFLQLFRENLHSTALRRNAAVEHLHVVSTESLGFLQNQLHGFRRSRPASHLIKACLHDTVFLE